MKERQMETMTAAKNVFLNVVTFLTQQLGENSTTSRTPIAVLGEREVDMNATVACCVSSDFDMLVSVPKYGTVEIELPEWLSPREWLDNQTEWKWAWGFGVEKSWPKSWQRFVAYNCCGNSARRLAVVKLLTTKNFRSAFRASLRAQLETWFLTPTEERQFDSPFSRKQWDSLCDRYVEREAKCLDNTLYYRR
jgi:hypothetical protein